MCTIGYHKDLKVIFKNRDKNDALEEVVVVKPDFLSVKSDGANYFSIGINKHGCAFAGAAVNTPEWTSLVISGKTEEAKSKFKKENKGLISPVAVLSTNLANANTLSEMLDMLLNQGSEFMGYNILIADDKKAAHIEVYRKNHHVRWIEEDTVITNHFKHIGHGPETEIDYPSSFNRLRIASGEIKNAVSIEDIFQTLKIQYSRTEEDIWRKGVFSTVSSAVIDIESHALYYTSDHEKDYARITGSIPPKGAEKVFIEMSRYIDLPTYHNIERGHPFYVEMIEEIESQIKRYHGMIASRLGNNAKLNALELGAGTGLCSLELIKHPFLELDTLEIDSECCKILVSHPESSTYNVILGDAVIYCKRHHYDLIVSTFAHDHIHYNKRFTFAKNIYNNLKKDGIYIMGGELLPYFSNDLDRKKALFKYHNYIIELALQHNRVQLSELENNALKSGLDMVGDFKRHEAMFEEEMASAGFTLVEKKKMGPLNRNDVGGVFVYMYRK